MSETKEPCEVKHIQRKNTMKMDKVQNTPLETRDKEHCETLRLKGKIYIETTLVKTR